VVYFQRQGFDDVREVEIFGNGILVAKLYELVEGRVLVSQQFEDDWVLVTGTGTSID
jgi:hypothetical protein